MNANRRVALVAGAFVAVVVGVIPFASTGHADVTLNGCVIVAAPDATTHTVCPGANLTGANLSNTNLTWAVLTGADLRGANLTGANLTGALVDGANLSGGVLTGANLTWAYANHANLSQVVFTNADLTSADLTGATMTGATFAGATLTSATLTGSLLSPGTDQTVPATSASGATATWPPSTTLTGTRPGSCTFAPGSLFPLGVTSVTCPVLDAASHRATGTFKVTVATPPPAPTKPIAAPGDREATVRWIRPSGDGFTPLTGYVVTPYIAGVPQPARTFLSSVSRQIVTGLTNGTTYTFTIAAQNAIGVGAASVATAPVTVGAPVAPTNVAAVPGNTQATVQWTAPTANAASITGFAVTPYIAGVPRPAQTFPGTATTQTLNGLTNGTAYTFSVNALGTLGSGSPLPFGADTFTRTVANGWGTADTGGAWTLGTKATDYQVTGSAATLTLGAPNTGAHARLLATSATDVDVSARFTADKASTGLGQWVGVVARRTSNNNEYRVRARIQTGGVIGLSVTAQINGVETAVGAGMAAPGMTFVPGALYDLRAQVAGTNPTTITARVWRDGQPEPGTWLLTRTDSTPTLQSAGSVGVWSYLSNTSTNAPVTISVDDFVAKTLGPTAVAVIGPPSLASAPIVIGAPGVPTSVTATPGRRNATVRWTAPAQTNGSAITGYVVTPYWGQVPLTPVTFSSTATTQTITGLWNQTSFPFPMSTSYTFRVAAINAIGTGPPSAMSSPVTPT